LTFSKPDFCGGLLGVPLSVDGKEVRSMSIMIDDRRLVAGSSGKSGGAKVKLMAPFRGETGGEWTTVDGRANDQDRTRSSARAWHPKR
jgi:hypothetical protein